MEALRLGRLVAASSMAAPRVDALVALMAIEAARLPARVDESGDLVLLEAQDRTALGCGPPRVRVPSFRPLHDRRSSF